MFIRGTVPVSRVAQARGRFLVHLSRNPTRARCARLAAGSRAVSNRAVQPNSSSTSHSPQPPLLPSPPPPPSRTRPRDPTLPSSNHNTHKPLLPPPLFPSEKTPPPFRPRLPSLLSSPTLFQPKPLLLLPLLAAASLPISPHLLLPLHVAG
ncbi:hypothetical protein DAI22_06g267800 [Oryza sativa Japonica Group]|nr:hypothetical protein DAI22_06g267800 [Oryza sativa Japonica Group]